MFNIEKNDQKCMQVKLFMRHTAKPFCYHTCVILVFLMELSLASFLSFFVVSSMAYDKITGFLLIKFLSD